MRQIQFIGTTPEELKKELLADVVSHLQDLKKSLTPKSSEEYLTRKEVSKLLGVSLVTLNDWDKKGIIKPYRIGNLVRYKKREIEDSLKEIKR